MMKEMKMDEMMEINGGNPVVKVVAEYVGKKVVEFATSKAIEKVFNEALKPTPKYESKQPGFNRP